MYFRKIFEKIALAIKLFLVQIIRLPNEQYVRKVAMNKMCGNIANQSKIKFFKDTFEIKKQMSEQN